MVALSGDGRVAATGSKDCTARVWSVDSGECVCVASGHTDGVVALLLSRDCRLMATGSYDASVR